ncbi:metallophosphoesterase family protein [Sorangium sp. So ce426]|uniref:metallophosphoesterase family protein n=1 Tax=Sorangium sp. So ce426 TaxID=3133312 RepID=UPI003F5AE6CA
MRDEDAYKLRFRHFAEFYRQVKGEEYPLDYEQQATIHPLPECGLLFLGLNSAWQIEHHHRARAGVHTGALARALIQLDRVARDDLRIAVWHHPVTSAEPDHLDDAGFLQQLAVAGFRVALHGHVHRAENQLYRYDMSPGGRRREIVSAGTFGAPARQWVPGYPLQYNLLLFSGGTMTVETRCREELNGAWRHDARWLEGTGRDPLPRYQIQLQ